MIECLRNSVVTGRNIVRVRDYEITRLRGFWSRESERLYKIASMWLALHKF